MSFESEVLEALCELPHRGATTANEGKARATLKSLLERRSSVPLEITEQAFRTPVTYHSEVLGGLVLVAIAMLTPWPAFVPLVLCPIAAGVAVHYFDWRESPLSRIPPQGTAHNLIVRPRKSRPSADGGPKKHVILMAHYDSAPVSALYLPSMVATFRQSLYVSVGVVALAGVLGPLSVLLGARLLVPKLLVATYLLVQSAMCLVDYLRFGYTNGAADNASGVAAAASAALRLWETPLPDDWEVELVLTCSEEANMKGSLALFKARSPSGRIVSDVYLVNIDSCGTGDPVLVSCSGSLTPIRYNTASNPVWKAAIRAAEGGAAGECRIAEWHTGDFDTLWWRRAGFPCITISAQTKAGLVPNLHRPSDVLANVEMDTVRHAAQLAERTVRNLAASV